jgi:hypothetical protein
LRHRIAEKSQGIGLGANGSLKTYARQDKVVTAPGLAHGKRSALDRILAAVEWHARRLRGASLSRFSVA